MENVRYRYRYSARGGQAALFTDNVVAQPEKPPPDPLPLAGEDYWPAVELESDFDD
jgi:hypothetical protein